MAQMEEQIKIPEKELQEIEMSNFIRCRVRNTVHKDAQGTQRGPQQRKKDPVRNEGYTNRNEQFIGKQEQSG